METLIHFFDATTPLVKALIALFLIVSICAYAAANRGDDSGVY